MLLQLPRTRLQIRVSCKDFLRRLDARLALGIDALAVLGQDGLRAQSRYLASNGAAPLPLFFSFFACRCMGRRNDRIIVPPRPNFIPGG